MKFKRVGCLVILAACLAWTTTAPVIAQQPKAEVSVLFGWSFSDGHQLGGNAQPGGCFITGHDPRTGAEKWRVQTVAQGSDPNANTWNGLPLESRFAAYPTYNHPVLLQGRKAVLGYPGHLWTEGFDYGDANNRLTALMNGAPNWREMAKGLRVRYVFWGQDEKTNYQTSSRPWENSAFLVASGDWGAIYDLDQPAPSH